VVLVKPQIQVFYLFRRERHRSRVRFPVVCVSSWDSPFI
jgi:hypothetical protein